MLNPRRIGLTLFLAASLVWVSACEDDTSPVAPVEESAQAASSQKDAQEGKGLFSQSEAGGEKVRVILELASMSDRNEVAEQARAQNVRVLHEYRSFPLLNLEVSENALEGITRSPRVVSWMEDVPEPPLLDASIPFINADDVHDLGLDGNGFVVAILDTGVDSDHPFYGDRIVAEACFSSDDAGSATTTLCPDGTTSQTGSGAADIDGTAACNNGPLCDHGSHVTGIAAGDGTGAATGPETGMAPGADIVAIQVFTRFNNNIDCPSGAPCVLSFVGDQIAGLQHVLDLADGTVSSLDLVAANMSLGGGNTTTACDSDSRKAPIDALLAADIATVISAGNQGFDNQVSAPGCISTAVTVGSVDESDQLFFDNRGPLLDLFAPGRGIVSSEDNGTFGNKSGTSMAAPHVTGAFAVLRQEWTTMSAADVLQLLQDTGVDLTYTSGSGTATTPRIDLLAAVQGTTDPPELTVNDASVTVDEGTTATNSGTVSDDETAAADLDLSASVGTVVNNDDGTWSWSFDSSDGPDESQTVTITATDEKDVTGDVSFDLVVENVDPEVDAGPDGSILEGDPFSSSGSFTDPGTDGWTVEVDWGDGSATETISQSGKSFDLEHTYADDGVYTVTVTVTDDDGGEGTDEATVTVANVAPTVTIDPSQVTEIDEGDALSVNAGFTDPGVEDEPFTAEIVCYDVASGVTVAGDVTVTESTAPDLEGTISGTCDYGDTSETGDPPTGTFTVTVSVVDKDDGEGSDDFDLTVNNVAPDAEIDLSGSTDVGGTPTFLAQVGDPVDFTADVTDPGSDDLFLEWDWDDGSTDEATYLVNPPSSDPFPSPDVDPRDITDMQTHTWSGACFYEISLTADDDDGGSDEDLANVVIAGTSGMARSAGYWQPQFRGKRSNVFDAATLDCYLDIVGQMSAVFNEEVDASTPSKAGQVLHPQGTSGSIVELLDQQLLAAWLNFANGAFTYDEMVDTTGDGVPDTPFSDAVTTAESVRLDPGATRSELEEQKDILEAINLMDES